MSYLKRLIRWVRLRTIDRNHVVDLGLNPGWYDTDFRLIHANFELLRQFVEREKPFDMIEWGCVCDGNQDLHKHCEDRAFVANEIKDLYHWWVNVYPKRDQLNPIYKADLPSTPEARESWLAACKESDELKGRWEKEDTENLIRLVKIRGHLWT